MSSFRRSVGINIIAQGLGSFAQPMLIIILARMGGPEIQGEFAKFKTWTDLLLAIGLAGLPQAFIYAINRQNVARRILITFTHYYAIFIFFAMAFAVYIGIRVDYLEVGDRESVFLYVALVCVGLASITHSRMLRGIYLTIDDGIRFSAITVIPSLAILIFVSLSLFFADFRYDIAYLAIGLLVFISSVYFERIIEKRSIDGNSGHIPFRTLFTHSTNVLYQSVLYMLQPVAAIFLIEWQGGGIQTVAHFSIATVAVSVTNTAISLVAPLLFNRWSRSETSHISMVTLKRILFLCGLSLVFSILLALVAEPMIDQVLGQDFREASVAVSLMLLSVPAVAFTRMISPAIHAAGRPEINTRFCVLRFGLFLALQWLLLFTPAGPLNAAAWAWLLAEWIVAAYTLYFVFRMKENAEETNKSAIE